MLNFLFWTLTLAGVIGLLVFTWRSAMRRRGFKLVGLLQEEGVLRQAIDVPVRTGRASVGQSASWLDRRGTLVLTRKRLAGFTHRTRWVLVRGERMAAGAVRAEGNWLVVAPGGKSRGTVLSYHVADAGGWAGDAARTLRGR